VKNETLHSSLDADVGGLERKDTVERTCPHNHARILSMSCHLHSMKYCSPQRSKGTRQEGLCRRMSGTSSDSARAAKWLRLKISRCVGCSAAYLEGIRTVFSPMGEQTECFNRSLELVLRSNKKPIPPGFCSYAHMYMVGGGA